MAAGSASSAFQCFPVLSSAFQCCQRWHALASLLHGGTGGLFRFSDLARIPPTRRALLSLSETFNELSNACFAIMDHQGLFHPFFLQLWISF